MKTWGRSTERSWTFFSSRTPQNRTCGGQRNISCTKWAEKVQSFASRQETSVGWNLGPSKKSSGRQLMLSIAYKGKVSISCSHLPGLHWEHVKGGRSLRLTLPWGQALPWRPGLTRSLCWSQVEALPPLPSLRESLWSELITYILGSKCYIYIIPMD